MILLQRISLIFLALSLSACDLSGKKIPPSGHGKESTGATFQIVSVSATVENDRVDPIFLTPVSKLVNFRACIIDSLFQKQVSNQRFSIWSRDGQVAVRVSEENGCLTWQERISLNYFSGSQYIYQIRIIRGEGVARGQLEIPLAINLWLHGEPTLPAVVDLAREQVPAYNDKILSFDLDETSHLWLESLDIQDIREASLKGGRLKLVGKIKIPTQFLTKDSFRRDQTVPIPSGRYNIKLVLLNSSEDSRQEVLAESALNGVEAHEGKIVTEINFSPTKIPSSGFYKIGFVLSPVNGPKGLLDFEGMFDLGVVSGFLWSGNVTGRLAADVYAKRGEYKLNIFGSAQPPEATAVSTTAYYVDKRFGCAFDQADAASATTSQRTVRYRLNFCIRRRDGLALREGNIIHVRKNNGEEVDLKTNESGCVDLKDTLTHNIFEPECRHVAINRFTNKELGLDEEVPLEINPWHAYGTFCQDARVISQEELKDLTDRKQCLANTPKSEFFIDAFDLNEQKVTYDIDNNLNLKIIKTMRLGINTRVLRPSNQIDERLVFDALRHGPYLLRYVLLRNGHEDQNRRYQVVDGGEVIATTSGGRMQLDIPFHVTDPRIIDSRNRIILELSTIDETMIELVDGRYLPKKGKSYDDIVTHVGLEPKAFEGNFEIKGNGYILLTPLNYSVLDGSAQDQLELYQPWIKSQKIDIDTGKFPNKFFNVKQLIEMGREVQRLEQFRQEGIKTDYVATQGLTEVKKEVPIDDVISYENLIQVMNSKSVENDIYRGFCSYFARTLVPKVMAEFSQQRVHKALLDELRRNCILNQRPGWLATTHWGYWAGLRHRPMFVFQNIIRAEEAKYEKLVPPGRGFQIVIGDQFSMGSRFVNTTDLTIRAPLGKIPVVGSLIELGAGLSNTSTWRLDHGSDLTFGENTVLGAEENSFDISINKYRRCVIMRMNPEMLKLRPLSLLMRWISDDVARSQVERTLLTGGFIACGDQESKPVEIREKYFYVQSARSQGLQQDPSDLRNRWFSLGIRSARDMRAFIAMGKSQIDNPNVMDATFDGLKVWTSNMDELFQAISPAAPGIFVEDVYH